MTALPFNSLAQVRDHDFQQFRTTCLLEEPLSNFPPSGKVKNMLDYKDQKFENKYGLDTLVHHPRHRISHC